MPVEVSWTRIFRFESADGRILLGQPLNPTLDVGIASFPTTAQEIKAMVFSGNSVLDSNTKPTGEIVEVKRILCPLQIGEVGAIRCIGLNYKAHAKESGMAEPAQPVLFLKPATALSGPYPSPITVSKYWQDEQSDYETEMSVIIGKRCKNVTEEEAMGYVLGYACSNDVSARKHQLANSQWCYGKGFDNSAPLGPVIVSAQSIPDIGALRMTGSIDGVVVQETLLSDMIFSVPKIISFLSQCTTLLPGTMIMTGTPSGIGFGKSPRQTLTDGLDFRVNISGGLGTLINIIKHE